MDVSAPRMTPGSGTLPRCCLRVTLFLRAILILLASVTSTSRSGVPLGAIATSVKELPGADALPGGVDCGPGRRLESRALASGPDMSGDEEVDTVGGWNDFTGGGEAEGVVGLPKGLTPERRESLAECQGAQRVRSRPRRSLTFPEGSKASLRVNFKYILFNTSNWLAYANGFRSAWDLPKNGSVALPFARSIQRREIYRDIEEIMVYHGLDGRACILRGLCEATQSIASGSGIVRRLLHLLFTVPEEEEHHLEEYSPKEYDWKRKRGGSRESTTSCDSLFSSCPYSLLDMNTVGV